MSASNSPFASHFNMGPAPVNGISTAGGLAREAGDSANVLPAGELSALKGGSRRPRRPRRRKITARRRTGARKGAKRRSSKRRSMRRRWL